MPHRTHPNRNTGIREVAQAAAVSTATVSRVLNRSQAVSDSVRQRVEAAIAALGYVPDAAARALTLRRSNTIGAMIPTLDHSLFARGVEAAYAYLAERNYQLLIAINRYDVKLEAEGVANLVQRGVDAMILMGASQSVETIEVLRRHSIPFVHTGTAAVGPDQPFVGFDNRRETGKGADYLIGLGHRRIAMVAGITRHNDRAAARVQGLRQSLRRHRLSLPAHWLVEQPYTIDGGRAGLRALWGQDPKPTAIVCGNDVLAFGVLFEAQRLGVKVPQQLSIIGFDDLPMASQVTPPLTTLKVEIEAMWREAAEYLLAVLGGAAPPSQRFAEVNLVVRGTTGPPAGRARSAQNPI